MSGKSDELAKMRKNDIFLMITAQTDSTMNLFLFEVCAVCFGSIEIEFNWIANDENIETTNKQTCDPTATRAAQNKQCQSNSSADIIMR